MREQEYCDTSLLDHVIGQYQLVALLGAGGFGQVYVGRHLHLPSKLVAIKLLHQQYLTSQKERDRFLQEASLLAQLKHPHIVPLVDVGVVNDRPYLITEYLPYGSLQDHVARQGAQLLPAAEVLTMLAQIGQACAYAHAHHIVHRDLKPANILFNARGEAVLADFGIGMLLPNAQTQPATTVVGSFLFMAPEQFQGEVSLQSDQYALACLAYLLVTGRTPFRAASPATLMYQHLYEYPPAPRQCNASLPLHMERALLRGLAKERTHRYPNIETFLAACGLALPPDGRVETAHAETASLWLEHGNALYHSRNYHAALAAYRQVLQSDPSCAIAYNNTGAALLRLGQKRAALSAYDQALWLDPGVCGATEQKGVEGRKSLS